MTQVKSESYPGWELFRSWERQRPPFVQTLPLTFRKRFSTQASGSGSLYPIYMLGPELLDMTNANNRAYSVYAQQLHDASQWANNILEVKESYSMVEKTAKALVGVALGIRHGDPRKVMNSLGMVENAASSNYLGKRLKRAGKSFGDKWLALHFGIQPMIQDIGSAVNAIQNPNLGSRFCMGEARDHKQEVLIDVNNQYGTVRQGYDLAQRVHLGSRVRVVNPNANLANQLGFTNPLSVAWEAVPYSFVVDWFSNVGQCLSACTDLFGLEVVKSYSVAFQAGSEHYLEVDKGYFDHNTYGVRESTGTSIYLNRQPGIAGPSLEVKPFKGFSPVRAATAISLLLQHL